MADKAEFEVELEDDVTPAAKKAAGSLGRLRKAFDKFANSSAGKALGKFAGVAKDVVSIAAGIGAGVAAAVSAMTVSMVDFNQRSMVAFRQIAKEGEVPEQLFQRAIDLAKQFGLDIKDTAQAAIRFRAFGFDQKQAETLVKMGADMRALGAESEEVKRAFVAFGQIQSATKLQGDELNQLAEAGIPVGRVYEQLAKILGKTVPEVIKMKEAGEINSGLALQGIHNALLDITQTTEAGQAAAEVVNKTLSGQAGKLKASFQDLFRRVAKDAEGPIVDVLATVGGKLSAFLDDPATQSTLVTVIESIAKAIDAVIPIAEEFLSGFAMGAKEAFAAFSEVAKELGIFEGDGKTVAQIAKLVGHTLGQVAVFALAVAGAFGAVIAAATVAFTGVKMLVVGVFNAITNFWGSLIAPVVDTFENISAILSNARTSMFEKMVQIGQALMQGLWQGIKNLAMSPVNAIRDVAGSIIDTTEAVLRIGSPSKEGVDIGENFGDSIALGGERTIPTIKGMTAGMTSGGMPSAPSGGGGAEHHWTLQVQAMPGATQADGEAFGEGIMVAMRRKIRSGFLDDAAIEAGV